MKVKVGDKVFDGSVEPVMVILTDKDKQNIADMPSDAIKYAAAPDDMFTEQEFRQWMRAI